MKALTLSVLASKEVGSAVSAKKTEAVFQNI